MRAWHKQNVRAPRLDVVVCNILLSFASIFAVFAVVGGVATRSHMFHVAYSRRRQTLENNAWLLEQCQSPDFYGNMKHHSTLCDDVKLAKSDALWLHALRDVIDETNPCGEVSCAARVQSALEWIMGRGLLTLGGAVFGLFVLFTLAVQMQRAFAPCPAYAPYAQAPYAQNPQAAKMHGHPVPQWYPLLTHSSADYPHQD